MVSSNAFICSQLTNTPKQLLQPAFATHLPPPFGFQFLFPFPLLAGKKKNNFANHPIHSLLLYHWFGYHNQRGIGLSNASPLTCVCNTCLLHSDSNSFFLFLFLTKNNNLPIVQTNLNPISNPSKSLNVPVTNTCHPPIPVPVRCTHQRAGERTSQNI